MHFQTISQKEVGLQPAACWHVTATAPAVATCPWVQLGCLVCPAEQPPWVQKGHSQHCHIPRAGIRAKDLPVPKMPALGEGTGLA